MLLKYIDSIKVVSSCIRYKEAKIATTSQIVQTRNVTLPQITACFANYTHGQFFPKDEVASLQPNFNQTSLIRGFRQIGT